MEFANFVCKFGSNLNLLDLLEEILLPAFLDTSLKREISETSYFFHNVRLLEVSDGNTSLTTIVGHLVKNTVLRRTQIFDSTLGLVADEQAIPSAPSALFVLVLNNHRLAYFRETSSAPTLQSFGSATRKFIREKYAEFYDQTLAERTRMVPSPTARNMADLRRALSIEIPRPMVDVIPLASEASLQEFIDQFDLISAVTINLEATNNEIDNDKFFVALREQSAKIGSTDTALRHRNSEGLSKSETRSQVKSAVLQGTSRVSLTGKDAEGDKLSGSNDDFRVRVPFNGDSEDEDGVAKIMVATLMRLFRKNVVRKANSDGAETSKLKRIFSRFQHADDPSTN
ncbi:MAG: hypothetical protein M3Y56_04985 [Armatimonadota bacterium]|nr:hypothetical protein [Armatimonadota bacterium]